MCERNFSYTGMICEVWGGDLKHDNYLKNVSTRSNASVRPLEWLHMHFDSIKIIASQIGHIMYLKQLYRRDVHEAFFLFTGYCNFIHRLVRQ